MLREKLIAVKHTLKKEEKFQICNLTLYLKELEKKGQAKLKTSR